MAKKDTVQPQPTTLWNLYQQGLTYQATIGIANDIPKFVDYYEGRQWKAPTEATRTLPRPVINITKLVCRNKKAGVLSAPVKVVYRSDVMGVDTRKFNMFADYIFREIQQRECDSKAIGDGVKKGTYVFHYYWDKNARGMRGVVQGGMRVENIDVLNFFVANPNETDEQKQKWLLIASREEVEAVKTSADKDVDKDLIKSDTSESKYQETEQEGTDYVTVLTRYFRVNGEVHWEKGTKSVMLTKATPLTPDLKGAAHEIKKALGEDPAIDALPDSPEEEIQNTQVHKFELYPVVVGQWEQRDKSIYGIGEVEGLIDNQDSINRNLAFFEKARRDTALGGWVVRPDALNGQLITNAPDQVITDHSVAGDGVKKLPVNNIPNDSLVYTETIVELTRMMSGATEVMAGEVLGKNMSGAAIAQLQSQAEKPIEELRQNFWRVKEKQGKVLENFFKMFYEEREYPVVSQVPGEENKVEGSDVFNGSQFMNTQFSVVTEAGAAAQYSEITTISALDKLLDKGLIDLEGYIMAYPESALGNKQDVLDIVAKAREGQVATLLQENDQMKDQLLQAAELIQKQAEIVKSASTIINENRKLNEMLITIKSEVMKELAKAKQAYDEAKDDATMFAQELAKAGSQRHEPSQVTTPVRK